MNLVAWIMEYLAANMASRSRDFAAPDSALVQLRATDPVGRQFPGQPLVTPFNKPESPSETSSAAARESIRSRTR
jgi:hypothetical protein